MLTLQVATNTSGRWGCVIVHQKTVAEVGRRFVFGFLTLGWHHSVLDNAKLPFGDDVLGAETHGGGRGLSCFRGTA